MSTEETRTGSLAQRTYWGVIREGQRLRYVLWCTPFRPRHVWRSLRLLGAYRQRGWFNCVSRRASVDRHGRALPWLTYPAIDWLDSALSRDDRVFEFGMGGSTVWMAERVKSVTSVDENPEWVARFKLPPNVQITVAIPRGDSRYAEEGDPYVAAIEAAGLRFDIVLVDGHSRLSCTEAAERALIGDVAPADQKGTAFGVYHFVCSVLALPSAVLFGWLWEKVGIATAFSVAAAGTVIAALALALCTRRSGTR